MAHNPSHMLAGWYYDPLHGGCLREIRRNHGTHTFTILGVYGDDEAPRTHQPWTARVFATDVDRDVWQLRVDFGGKPGKQPRYLSAIFRDRKIEWEDGNTWIQLYTCFFKRGISKGNAV